MRILLVTQMYPGPDDPDLGTFVAELERALTRRGHELARAAVTRRGGGPRRHLTLALDTRREARRLQPDVVYAHFLAPAGLWGTLFGRAPLVVTAHGQDVENARTSSLARTATRFVVSRAAAVVAVSQWLRGRLEEVVPQARGKTEVIDCGVDLEVFAPRDPLQARARVGWQPAGTAFVCLGALSERKNVGRLARAFTRRGEGALAFVGDGPLRAELERREGIVVAGSVAHERAADWLAAADVVVQPSIQEPFGLATLEGMASGRSVVATRVGGPAEFVTAEAGVLVDPEDEEALVAALEAASHLPRPNVAARAAAEPHGLDRQVDRIEAILERAARSRR